MHTNSVVVAGDPAIIDDIELSTTPLETTPIPTYWRVTQEEEPVWLCEVTAEPVTFHTCLTCARQRLRPSCPFPPSLLAALHTANQPDDVIEGIRHTGYPVVRVSSLLGCKHKSWLGRTQRYPLEKPSEHWTRLRGSLIHKAIESMGMAAGGLSEKRLTAFVWSDQIAAFVSGRVDLYDVDSRTLFDFKTVNTSAGGIDGLALPKARHVKQMQIYSWLLAQNGYPPPESIRIAYLTMSDLRTFDAPAPDTAMFDRIQAWITATLADILSPTPPPAKPVEHWECRYCPFTQCVANKREKAKG